MALSNYADRPSNDYQGALPEHRDRLSSNPRAYTPSDGENDEGGYSTLAANSNGDWSWKPFRDRVLGDDLQTFTGVPPSAAELYGRMSYSPA